MPDRVDILVLGAGGMLGAACMRSFGDRATGRDLSDFDLAVPTEARRAIARLRPRLIINCAAATDVDRCEIDHDYADRGNSLTAKNAAQAAAGIGARLLHVSTNFVFSGDNGRPYVEDDAPDPVNYYGRSKLAAERSVSLEMPDATIVRTSWLYGHGGTHFPGKVLEWASKSGTLNIVSDQAGSPTYADDLAQSLRTLVERNVSGIYHLGGSGCATRFEWAQETIAVTGLDVEMIPALSSDFPASAPRPANSCLDCTKAARLGVQLPPWREGLARYIRSA